MPADQQAYLLSLDLRLPQLDWELDELAVLLDELPQLFVISQLLGVLLQEKRDTGSSAEVPRLFSCHLQRSNLCLKPY